MGARDDDSDADAAQESGGQRGINGFAQFGAPDFRQVGQGYADDQCGLNPFAESDNECIQHSS